MIIDAFAHIYPRAFLRYLEDHDLGLPVFFQDTPTFTSGAERVDELDRHGIDRQVICLGTPSFDELFVEHSIAQALECARLANEGIANIVTRAPDRFIGVGTLPLVGLDSVDAAVEELEHMVSSLGLRGVQLYTDVAGHPLDDERLFPLYEALIALDMPVLLHPKGGDYNVRTHDYLTWLTFGWPFETSLAMSRLVHAGVLERFSALKIVTHHLGAFIPHMAARIAGVGYTLARTSDWSLPRPLLDYFQQFYGDTAVNGYQPALDSGRAFFGAQHILFGTDWPFVPIGPQLQAVTEWDIPTSEKRQIMCENAMQLFHL